MYKHTHPHKNTHTHTRTCTCTNTHPYAYLAPVLPCALLHCPRLFAPNHSPFPLICESILAIYCVVPPSACVQIYAFTCIWITYTCSMNMKNTHKYTYMCTYTYVYIYIHISIHTHTCKNVHRQVYMYDTYIHTHIYTYI